MSDLSVKGANFDVSKSYVSIMFIPCYKEEEASECATENEVTQFTTDNKFFLHNFDKYIDFENVVDYEETLQKTINLKLSVEVDLQKLGSYHFYLIEHRTQLIDNNMNFLGFMPPNELNYFNFDDNIDYIPESFGQENFYIALNLSKKVVN